MFKNLLSGGRKRSKSKVESTALTHSKNHDLPQVVGFSPGVKDGKKEPDIRRELYSVPKPEEKETMADHINNHKQGDIFPYFAITGRQEEQKDGRLARLRSYTSPYGKSVKPDMRINGISLDQLEGKLHIDDLKAHVDQNLLSKEQSRQNKKFKNLDDHVFKKPYVQLVRVTGEFVPLLSNSADYTDLMFSLQDDRLLENQTVVQSNKIPTNSNGVFELACDYCIPTKDIRQLSLVYNLARPIMREDFQWGAVSLTIRVAESDTPYLTPKVEAMAIVRAPYTAVEEADVDLDHKDVTYTTGHIKRFREMYMNGEIVDNDMPLQERLKSSSYSKSSMRGAVKGVKGPDHFGEQSGWGHLDGMRKPKIGDDLASVSVPSGEDEDDGEVEPMKLELWKKQQEKLRLEAEERMQMTIPKKSALKKSGRPQSPSSDDTIDIERDNSEEEGIDEIIQSHKEKVKRRGVNFNVEDT